MIKLIALDLDGTLLDPGGAVTDRAKQAVAAARARGVRVVLSTGRPAVEAAWFAREAGCDSLAVCLGGAALVDTRTGEVLLRRDLPHDTGRQALALCLGRGIELMIFAGDHILVDPFSRDSLLRSYPYPAFHRAAVTVDDPLAYLDRHNLPLTKLHADGDPAAYPLEELARLPGLDLTRSNDHDFELVALGVDKGQTLESLARLYGVHREDCAAVGDSDNDLAMLRWAGLPVAMGNAPPAVRAAAARVAPPNHREGAAAAILGCLEDR